MKIRYFFLLILFVCAGCETGDTPAEKRARHIERSKGDIVFGAADSWAEKRNKMWQGIEMAVDEINAAGGVLGRKVKVIRKDDQNSVDYGSLAAQAFAENPDISAVIGHNSSYVSIAAAITYQYYGILMLSPLSTGRELTSQGFDMIFRNLPNDEVLASHTARFCRQQGLKKILIYGSDDAYGNSVSTAFEAEAEKMGLQIVDRMSYDPFGTTLQFVTVIRYWQENYDFDAIFLGGGIMPPVADLISEIRRQGITLSILGTDNLDAPELLALPDHVSDKVYTCTVFDDADEYFRVDKFSRAFIKRYGSEPDIAAAQGYDAVMVLCHAIRIAKSANPQKIADTLRSMGSYEEGLTGPYSFDEKGDVTGKKVLIKMARGGRFQLVDRDN
ncbi:MAG: hypothetical protein CSB24_02265 [Deltaproteobacteria bacterium]|nr:MAG: hypothetical protein CSB24_02265 [Deltaproteobacteria bacterium]